MSSYLVWFVLFGTLAVLCSLAAADEAYFLAVLCGIGAVFAVGHPVDRKMDERRAAYFLQSMDMMRSIGQSLHPSNVGRLPAR